MIFLKLSQWILTLFLSTWDLKVFLVFLQAFSLPLLEADTSLTRNSMPVSTVPWIEKEINEKGKKKKYSSVRASRFFVHFFAVTA